MSSVTRFHEQFWCEGNLFTAIWAILGCYPRIEKHPTLEPSHGVTYDLNASRGMLAGAETRQLVILPYLRASLQ